MPSAVQLPWEVVGPYGKLPVRFYLPPAMLLSIESCLVEHRDTDSPWKKATKAKFCIHLIYTGLSQTSLLWTSIPDCYFKVFNFPAACWIFTIYTKIIYQPCNGSQYVQLSDVLIIEDVTYKLMWEEFWLQNGKNWFSRICRAMKIKEKFNQKKRCPEEFEGLPKDIKNAKNAFLTFKAECKSRSEVC